MNQIEAWASGPKRVDFSKDHLPIVVYVELVKVAFLVQVMARAESDDPKLRGFAAVLLDVRTFPQVVVAKRDPLEDMGQQITQQFARDCVDNVLKELAAQAAAPPS